MANKHPYVSATGVLIQVLDHLKRSFPTNLDADVLRKLGFAPKNESYILNTLRFINLIDEKGLRTDKAQRAFTLHDSGSFVKAFSEIVKAAYADLFRLHGDSAWTLDAGKLITYFRQADQSTQLVGSLQANTFKTLAAYAGKTAASVAAPGSKSVAADHPKRKPGRKGKLDEIQDRPPAINNPGAADDRSIGLTVRVEINLPSAGDQDTYDKIFKSIRKNLLNG